MENQNRSKVYEFLVRPFPAPRLTQGTRSSKQAIDYKEKKAALRKLAKKQGFPVDDSEVVGLEAVFEFEVPRSWSKKKKAAMVGKFHRQRPDGDNLHKALQDSLFPKRDDRIAQGEFKKVWGVKNSIQVTIWPTKS